ncbi:hypothetical protein CEUSTIGMA_g1841.t1 [Chlamydomonas eustigma]|uniref:R3H domain-containing protein n=1 Tax=Chlamydomonas eustigma TaxID=1157962 RepID=A0A250WU89_9CHLO|nr:hypothetical protein CEUSTIGMA_g1841.t1 [Chlamydomonas eustigma]|eukprot:GAX74393.1 hypothetical protein CEUSTIGMA_g1841.t1 [Chlamydomonas eustigma]
MRHMTEKIQILVEEAESKLLEGDVFAAECMFKEVARLRSASLAEQASSSGTSSSRRRNHKVNLSATGVVSISRTLSSQQASNDTESAASPSNVSVSCGSTPATAATTPLAPPSPGLGSSTSTVTPNTSVTENSSAATAAIPTPGGRRVPVPGARLFRNALLGARVPAVSNRSRANTSTSSRSYPIPVVAGMNDSGTLDGKGKDTFELNVHQESLAAATAASSFELGEAIDKRMESSTISRADHYVCNYESVAEAAGTDTVDNSSCYVVENGRVAECGSLYKPGGNTGNLLADGREAITDDSNALAEGRQAVDESNALAEGREAAANESNALAEGGEGQEEWEASWTEGLGRLMQQQQQQQDAISSRREGGIMADVQGSLMNGIEGSCTAASKRALAGSTFGAHQLLLLDHQHLVMTSGTRGNGGGGGSSSVDGTVEDEKPPAGGSGDRRSSAAVAVAAARREKLAEPASHVVEVYGMNPDVKTMHIEMFLDSAWLICGEGKVPPVIRWVDDNHALLVCPDASTARNLLELEQHKFLLRPHDQASQASRDHPAIELLAPRERPKTTAAVAKRVLSHVLGIPQLRDKTAEADLSKQRRAAKDEKQRKERARDEVWE